MALALATQADVEQWKQISSRMILRAYAAARTSISFLAQGTPENTEGGSSHEHQLPCRKGHVKALVWFCRIDETLCANLVYQV